MRIDMILDYVNTIIQIVLNTQWCDLIQFCKHVQTCSTQTWQNTFILSKLQTKWHTTTKLFLGLPCSESIWYELLRFMWFSNMSELVQIQYDMNCYNSCDSQTCLNMLKHV